MMRNLIFDLENGGSTYTRGQLINKVVNKQCQTYCKSKIEREHGPCKENAVLAHLNWPELP